MEAATRRPQRWDAPFGEPLRDGEVERLLAVEPSRSVDPTVFPAALPLREILRNDSLLLRLSDGEIIVREGDDGHSVFLLLSGRVRVVLSGLTPEQLGRESSETLGWLATFARVVGRSRLPEVRDNNSTPVPSLRAGGNSP